MGTMLNLILPQYLLLNHSKKLLWFYLNNLIVKVKYYAFLTYAHGVVALSSFVKALLQKYLLNFSNKFYLTKRKRLTIMLKEGLHAWTFEDRARVKNIKTIAANATPIFKL